MSWLGVWCVSLALVGPPDMPGVPGLLGGQEDEAAEQEVVPEVPDSRIEQRISRIYAEVEGLSEVQVDVDGGVVTLRGTVVSDAQRGKALRLAKTARGVVEVVDEIELPTGIWARVRPALGNLGDRMRGLLVRLPVLLVAGLAFALFMLLARLVARWEWLFKRFWANPFLRSLARQVVAGAIMLAGAIVALELLDATAFVGAILGAAGIFGLALGFAFKDTVQNYIASVLLSLRQPFDPDDYVCIGDDEGRILRLTSRATILMTLDGNHVRIPNSTVYQSTIVNFTRQPLRRFYFDVRVSTTNDLVETAGIAVEALRQMEGIARDPRPEVQVMELGESRVGVRVFGWMDQRTHDWFRVRSEAVRLVKTAFDDQGVSMPDPIYNLRLWNEDRSFAESEVAMRRSRPGAESAAAETIAHDTRPDRAIDRQVAAEKAGQENLLDPEAPKE